MAGQFAHREEPGVRAFPHVFIGKALECFTNFEIAEV
jgi:hypothetical protein